MRGGGKMEKLYALLALALCFGKVVSIEVHPDCSGVTKTLATLAVKANIDTLADAYGNER
jgi:hypothetical protein